MEVYHQKNHILSETDVIIKSNDMYLNSDGFYPQSVNLESKIILLDTLFYFYSVSQENYNIKVSKDEPIQFMKDLIIKQQKSGKYLTAIYIKDKWTIQLTEELDNTCLFSIQPCYKSQIINQNCVTLYNEVHLSLSPNNSALGDSQDCYFTWDSYQITFTNQVHLATNFIFETINKTICKLSYGSLIKIKLIEKNAYLVTSTKKSAQIQTKNLINQQNADFQYDALFSQDLIVTWQDQEQLSDFDLWRIYHPHKAYQQITLNDQFYLQNIAGNLYISQQKLVSNIKDASLFSFQEISTNNHFISGFLIFQNMYFSSQALQKENNLYHQLDYKQVNSKEDQLLLELQINTNQTQIYWLLSVVRIIQNSINIFSQNQELLQQALKQNLQDDSKCEKVLQTCEQLTQVLSDLICFCLENGSKLKVIDRNSIFNSRKDKRNQDQLKRYFIIQYLSQLLELIQWNDQLTNLSVESDFLMSEKEEQSIKLRNQIQQVIKTIFLFFSAFSAFNEQNGLFILYSYSKYFSLLGCHIGAFDCLIQIFQTNQILIPTASSLFFNYKGVNKQQNELTLIDLIFQRGWYVYEQKTISFWSNIPKFLQILCNLNDVPYKNNQKVIGTNMQTDNLIFSGFLSYKEDQLFYLKSDDKFIELNQIYQSVIKNNLDIIVDAKKCKTFIDEYLNLVGSLCQNRQVSNIIYFKNKFPKEHLISYVSNLKNDDYLRCKLMAILINLYIDFHPFQRIQISKLIFKSYKQQNDEDFEEELLQVSKSKIQSQEIQFIESIQTIVQDYLKRNLIVQNQVNLCIRNYQMLNMYLQLLAIKLPNQKKTDKKDKNYSFIDPKYHLYFEFLILAFQLLPDSIQENSPNQDQLQQFEQFSEDKNVFNLLTKCFIEFVYYLSEIFEKDIIQACINSKELNSQEKIKLQFNIPIQYIEISNTLLKLLSHKQLASQTKLKIFNLIDKLFQPKKAILLKFEHCMILEKQNEIDKLDEIEEIQNILLELLYNQNIEQQLQNTIQKLRDFNQKLNISEYLLLSQRLMRILNLEQNIFEILNCYIEQCRDITKKLLNDPENQRNINKDEDIIQLCQELFNFLRITCQNNHQNKINILKQFSIIEQFFSIIDLGQFNLLITIYDNSFELIESISPKTIYLLFQNISVGTLRILQCIISQQNLTSVKNLVLILQQLTSKSQFTDIIGLGQLDYSKLFDINQNWSHKQLLLLGKAPYIVQIQGYKFLIHLIQLFISSGYNNQIQVDQKIRIQKQQDYNQNSFNQNQIQINDQLHPGLLQNCFPYTNLFKLIFSLEDIFSMQIKDWSADSPQNKQKKDLNQMFLNTILKHHLLSFLNLLLTQSEFSNYDDEYIDLIKKFIVNERKLFSIQILSMNYQTYINNIESQKKLKLLYELYEDHHKVQQSNFSIITEYEINQYFDCFLFNNYSILLFDLSLNLVQKLSEYIDTLEDSSTKSKSNRNSSTLIFKKKTQSISLIDFGMNESSNLSHKFAPLNDLKILMDDFIYQIEQHLNDKLTIIEIKENQELLYLKQQQLKLLFLRQLDFKGFKFNQQKVNNIHEDVYLSPEYFNDSKLHELIKIQGILDSKITKRIIETLINTHQDQAEENFLMFKSIYTKSLLMNSNYEIQIENFPKIIVPLVRILKQSLNNLISNYQGVLNILDFFWQLLDFHTYLRANYEETISIYVMNQKDKFNSQSEQILQKKAIKQLQNLICNEGFLEIFVQFCDSYYNLKVIPYIELGFINQNLKDELFTKFLLVSTRLIRGQEEVNSMTQEKIIQIMKNTQSNSLLKIFCMNFSNFFKLNDIQKMRDDIVKNLNRVLLSYEFNQFHRLERTTNSQKLSIIRIQIKFLQLMAEDHFRQAQDFLRIQEGFSQNYDMIQYLQDILFNQFTQETFINLSFDDYELIVGCFDCIKELIQGPCHENQMKICSIQFLKLCYKLLNFDDSHASFVTMYKSLIKEKQQIKTRSREKTQNEFNKLIINQKKTLYQQDYVEFYKKYPSYCKRILQSFRKSNNINYKLFMLSEIKYRCSTTLESLTDDQQTSSQTLEKINSIINEKLLIKNIAIQYEKFKILHSSGKNYTNKIFSHIFGDLQKLSTLNYEIVSNEEKSWNVEENINVEVAIRDFCDSFIIETGFSLYNVLAQIFQHKNMDVIVRIYQQIYQEKTQKKQLKQLLLYKLYQSWFQLQKITEMITNNIVKGKQKEVMNDKIFLKIYNSKIIQQDKYLLKQNSFQNTYDINELGGDKEIYQKKLGYRALRFYATRSGSIEIILPQKQIKQVIFPLLPHCFSLNNQIKLKFSKDIDRSTQQTKVESILYNSKKIIQKLKTEYQYQLLYKRHFLVNMIAGNQEIWKQIIFYVIVMQNILILLTSNGRYDHLLDDFLLALNILQIVLQFVCFFIFIIRKLPYLRIKAQEIVIERQINRIRKREIKYKYLDNSQSVVLQEDFILARTDKFLLEQNKLVRLYQKVTDRLVLFKYIFFDYEMIYFLIFTSIAISGLFTKTLLALLLLDVFWRFPMLTAMINSVWRPIIQILLTLALFFILQYYYSLIIYDFYAEDSNYGPYCQNLLQCFSFILDATFKKDSGSAGYVAASDGISSTYANPDFRFGMLSFWEFCYYFFVISLTYSIFTGLILDSFGADREEAEELETDIKEFCLVCGIDKGIIEKKTKHKKGFRFHVKNEHYVWNYIFFISYIQEKKRSEYNGIESYVDDEIKRESIVWFPISRSLSIVDQDDVDKIDEMIDQQLIKISQSIERKLYEKGLKKDLKQT